MEFSDSEMLKRSWIPEISDSNQWTHGNRHFIGEVVDEKLIHYRDTFQNMCIKISTHKNLCRKMVGVKRVKTERGKKDKTFDNNLHEVNF